MIFIQDEKQIILVKQNYIFIVTHLMHTYLTQYFGYREKIILNTKKKHNHMVCRPCVVEWNTYTTYLYILHTSLHPLLWTSLILTSYIKWIYTFAEHKTIVNYMIGVVGIVVHVKKIMQRRQKLTKAYQVRHFYYFAERLRFDREFNHSRIKFIFPWH